MARNAYEELFTKKIDLFSTHSRYEWLKKQADFALIHHTGYGLEQIISADFMDRIIVMPISYISDWLDGKNNLKWVDEETGERFDPEDVIIAVNKYVAEGSF